MRSDSCFFCTHPYILQSNHIGGLAQEQDLLQSGFQADVAWSSNVVGFSKHQGFHPDHFPGLFGERTSFHHNSLERGLGLWVVAPTWFTTFYRNHGQHLSYLILSPIATYWQVKQFLKARQGHPDLVGTFMVIINILDEAHSQYESGGTFDLNFLAELRRHW